jgi:hypothetical protein
MRGIVTVSRDAKTLLTRGQDIYPVL